MAYNRGTRDTTKFPDLTDGQFHYSGPDPEGKVLAGFGRPSRDKWIEFRQNEITAILLNAGRMLVTDDQRVRDLLADLAEALHASRKLTLAEVYDDPALGKRFVELREQGHSSAGALAALTKELADAKAKTARPKRPAA